MGSIFPENYSFDLIEEGFFVRLVFDMVDEDVFGPAEFTSHTDVEFALEVVFALLRDSVVMSPANFSRQWREFSVFSVNFVKNPHTPQI